ADRRGAPVGVEDENRAAPCPRDQPRTRQLRRYGVARRVDSVSVDCTPHGWCHDQQRNADRDEDRQELDEGVAGGAAGVLWQTWEPEHAPWLRPDGGATMAPCDYSRPYSRILYSSARELSSSRSAARVRLPPVRSSAFWIRRRSSAAPCFLTDSSSSPSSGASIADTGIRTCGGRSFSPMRFPSARTIARSIVFSSSRTLPGQGYASSSRIASASTPSMLSRSLRLYWSTKWCTSSGISSRRWRSGTRWIGTTAIRQYRSRRKLPSRISSSRSLFVAETRRTSTSRDFVSPSRRTSPSCSTRRSLTCSVAGISPISSRKSVPPDATSKRPGLSRSAPVKAPRTYPNSSDSSRFSGIAPQLTGTNAALARSLSV